VLFGALYGESLNVDQISPSLREAEVQKKMWCDKMAHDIVQLTPILQQHTDAELMNHPLYADHIKQMGAALRNAVKEQSNGMYRLNPRTNDIELKRELPDQPGRFEWRSLDYFGCE
jgi:hypothetical protein